MEPRIVVERDGARERWRVGGCSLTLFPDRGGWSARVACPEWGGDALRLDGRFSSRDDAADWCRKMAHVFAREIGEGG
jgi:hypothetical protein